MPRLMRPQPRLQASFLAAMAEFRAEGRGGPGMQAMLDNDLRQYADDSWQDPAVFTAYVARLRTHAQQTDSEAPVTGRTLWWTEGDQFLGFASVRHSLTPALRERGGHIGYVIRPSARRRGHATALLAAALQFASSLGVESALLTCDAGNIASRRVIESNGGVLEDERAGVLRFWVPTRPAVAG
ncbi:GNAT family N-acetyltransferase [Streptomyces sp. CoH27]|uniref:GNAT family N-acetyltransferase n=1 Tax=Streptomyces sp. CoH27 TaxID=2875763 RepID=UPI001CD759A9|nr:GNAT family N-acetyltransferase [Streptomyces sp. CoH27]